MEVMTSGPWTPRPGVAVLRSCPPTCAALPTASVRLSTVRPLIVDYPERIALMDAKLDDSPLRGLAELRGMKSVSTPRHERNTPLDAARRVSWCHGHRTNRGTDNAVRRNGSRFRACDDLSDWNLR